MRTMRKMRSNTDYGTKLKKLLEIKILIQTMQKEHDELLKEQKSIEKRLLTSNKNIAESTKKLIDSI